MLRILKTVPEMRNYIHELKINDQDLTIGFVPTMGSLHQGHFELIRKSKEQNDKTVVSIFVNPTQFNNRDDFDSYPIQFEKDFKALEDLKVDAVFTPDENEIYPNGYYYKLTETKDSIDLCGKARPGHFDGVLSVLIRLFNLIKPSNVYMGLKDYQQYLLVKNMSKDLFLDLEVHGIDTVRESSGLALSSRNLNLTADQKLIADKFAGIFAKNIKLENIKAELEALDLKIDYLVSKWNRKFVAVFIGEVRLIDNRPLELDIQDDMEISSNNNIKPLTISDQNSRGLDSSVDFKAKKISNAKNILFKMSGSIACYKACEAISKLVQRGHKVQIIATKDVFNFVGQATLEGLTGIPVLSDLYKEGDMMSHIHLNDWCDLTVLCPASANTLAKISMGLCDNLVTTLALSTDIKKPYLIFPAMNSRMLESQPIKKAILTLQSMNKEFVFGEEGHLACGHKGQGRLAEPIIILNAIENVINKMSSTVFNPLTNKERKKILITAGGTLEPIDPVRYVSNISTGATGLKILEHLSSDYEIYLLGSDAMRSKVEGVIENLKQRKNSRESSIENSLNISNSDPWVRYFKSFHDLEIQLKDLLSSQNFAAIIHLAAVSDYSPIALHLNDKTIALPTTEKLASNEDFFIEFKRNKKLISEIKKYSINKDIKIIGFKLLRTDNELIIKNEIEKILKDSDCVVVNSMENISDKKHIYEIYNLAGLIFHGSSKKSLAEDIAKILQNEVQL